MDLFSCLYSFVNFELAPCNKIQKPWACMNASVPGDNQQRAFCRRYFLKSTDISSVVKFKISGSEHEEPVSAVS